MGEEASERQPEGSAGAAQGGPEWGASAGAVSTGVLDGALDAMEDAVGAVQDLELWQAGEGDLLDALLRVEGVLARLASARLTLVREADERGAATATGAPSTAAWLRAVLHSRPGTASRDVRLARSLAERWQPVAARLSAGEITFDQATAVVRALESLPEGTGADTAEEAQGFLLEKAAAHDPAELARLGKRLNAVLDPDGREPDDEGPDRAKRHLTVATDSDGWVYLKGRLTPEDGAALTAALSPLSAPRPSTEAEGADTRSAGQRRADALGALVRRLLDGGDLPAEGGERPHLAVTVSWAYLLGLTGVLPAEVGGGGMLGYEAVRRLACDSQVVPVVLGSDGQPLDVGRASRSVPPAMRRALVARDGGCAFPGCDRPPTWCEAHHIVHWAEGGPTAVSNLVLVCGHHHRRIHHDGWRVDIGPDGHPTFTPPEWVRIRHVPQRQPGWRHELAQRFETPPETPPEPPPRE